MEPTAKLFEYTVGFELEDPLSIFQSIFANIYCREAVLSKRMIPVCVNSHVTPPVNDTMFNHIDPNNAYFKELFATSAETIVYRATSGEERMQVFMRKLMLTLHYKCWQDQIEKHDTHWVSPRAKGAKPRKYFQLLVYSANGEPPLAKLTHPIESLMKMNGMSIQPDILRPSPGVDLPQLTRTCREFEVETNLMPILNVSVGAMYPSLPKDSGMVFRSFFDMQGFGKIDHVDATKLMKVEKSILYLTFPAEPKAGLMAIICHFIDRESDIHCEMKVDFPTTLVRGYTMEYSERDDVLSIAFHLSSAPQLYWKQVEINEYTNPLIRSSSSWRQMKYFLADDLDDDQFFLDKFQLRNNPTIRIDVDNAQYRTLVDALNLALPPAMKLAKILGGQAKVVTMSAYDHGQPRTTSITKPMTLIEFKAYVKSQTWGSDVEAVLEQTLIQNLLTIFEFAMVLEFLTQQPPEVKENSLILPALQMFIKALEEPPFTNRFALVDERSRRDEVILHVLRKALYGTTSLPECAALGLAPLNVCKK